MATFNRNETIDIFKVIALIGVITLHIHSALPGEIYSTSPFRLLNIGINQLSRLSVPLFVAISGYLLAKKYQQSVFKVLPYLSRRLGVLIPAYLFWSVWIFLTLKLIPEWAAGTNPLTLSNLLIGGLDYHLYFVPMLISLYLIFPVIIRLKKYLPILLIAGIIAQIAWYLCLPNLLLSDQQQYLIPLTWISYFIFGTYLAYIPVNQLAAKKILFFTGICLGIAWIECIMLQNRGIDIIVASRFTRVSVMAYALGVIALLFHFVSRPVAKLRWLSKLGQYSFLVYLSHTMWLRLLLPIKTPLSLESALLACLLLISGTLISYRWLK